MHLGVSSELEGLRGACCGECCLREGIMEGLNWYMGVFPKEVGTEQTQSPLKNSPFA